MKPLPLAMLLPNILIYPLGEIRLAENADYTLGDLSFPICLLRKAFFKRIGADAPMNSLPQLHSLRIKNFAFRSDNFLDWLQVGKERLVSGHGSLELILLLTKLQAISEANAPHARSL